jgi:hypothetical protein
MAYFFFDNLIRPRDATHVFGHLYFSLANAGTADDEDAVADVQQFFELDNLSHKLILRWRADDRSPMRETFHDRIHYEELQVRERSYLQAGANVQSSIDFAFS